MPQKLMAKFLMFNRMPGYCQKQLNKIFNLFTNIIKKNQNLL